MMKSMDLQRIVKRKKIKIAGDPSRVIALPHIPTELSRIGNIIFRVLKLTDKKAEKLLQETLFLFADRHKNIQEQFLKHYDKIADYVPKVTIINKTKKLLIGAYLTMEYSIESAALFNPSIVPHPDQTLLPKGSMRFIMKIGRAHV